MHFLFTLLADDTPAREQTDPAATLESYLTPGMIVLCTAGLCILIIWFFFNGRYGSLKHAPVRRYRWWFMFWPIVMLFSWNIGLLIVLKIISVITGSDLQSLPALTQNLVTSIVYITLIVIMLWVAHKAFARQLRGFGVNLRTFLKDFGFAFLTLLALFPLIQLAQIVVLVIGKIMYGEYEIQQHQTLSFLTENHNTTLMILTITNAAFIIPIFEETLFRGFMQSTLRGAIAPWKAIFITSLFFSLIHYPYVAHMPALFFLSCGLGYAYERSGSLLRSILIHMLFNGLSIAAVMLTSS